MHRHYFVRGLGVHLESGYDCLLSSTACDSEHVIEIPGNGAEGGGSEKPPQDSSEHTASDAYNQSASEGTAPVKATELFLKFKPNPC